MLLSLSGGALGVALAYAGVVLLRGVLPANVPQANPITVGLAPLLFALATCVVVGMLFGVAPAIQSAGVDAIEVLRSKGSSHAVSRRGHWLRNTLVASEIALSLALLIGAGLLLRTFAHLRATDVGVKPEHVLTTSILLPEKRYATFEQGRQFFEQLTQRLEDSPGVRAAAVASKLPLQGGNNSYITIPGQQTESMTGPLVETTAMGAHYFDVMGIPLLAGRAFTKDDFEITGKCAQEGRAAKTEEETKAVMKKYVLPTVINQTMAKTFWPKGDALGKVFELGPTFQVVGMVGDVKQFEVREAAIPEAYFPLTWHLTSVKFPYSLAVRGEQAPEALTSTVRSAVQAQDRGLALFDVRTMSQIIEESMSDTRYQTTLLSAMAALALILAAVGTYGVMSYVVGQRSNEIGIRVALGAQRGQIMAMVLKQGAMLAGAGIVVGLVAAAGGARLMQSLLVGVAPVDPLIYGSVALVLALVALAACYMPVRRAMAVDPMVALRDE